MLRRAVVVLALGFAACGSDPPAPPAPDEPAPHASATPSPEPRAHVRHARCDGSAGCAAVTGRVLYVEAVDPDGDGDAHYVLAGGSVTAPGVSVIDVGRDLRPRRLPHAGELVSAAGPVFTGSYGQQQIEAAELHHQRPRQR